MPKANCEGCGQPVTHQQPFFFLKNGDWLARILHDPRDLKGGTSSILRKRKVMHFDCYMNQPKTK